MKAIRLFNVAGGQSVLVIELPRRQGLSEARVVTRSSVRSRSDAFYFNDAAECSRFVHSFGQRNASFAVAGLLDQGAVNVR